MQILSSSAVANLQHRGIRLPGALGAWLGPVPESGQLFIWGGAGSGKSTLSAILAHLFAQLVGPAIYVSAEEHLSKTVTDRVKRLGIEHPALFIATFSGLCDLREAVTAMGARVVVLDSISKADPNSTEGESFLTWARAEGILVILVAHATKAHTYRGESTVPHEVDAVIRAWKDESGEHRASWTYAGGKNRFGGNPELDPYTIPMTAADVPRADVRQNPVEPFETTLGAVLDRHKVRGITKLQALVSDQSMCLPKGRRYVHGGDAGPLSFRYTRDSGRGQSQLDVFAEGKKVDTICAASFAACLRQLRDKHGRTKLFITDQRHAKLVLGAKEYARQERKQGKAETAEREKRLKAARAAVKKDDGKRPPAEACSVAGAVLATGDTKAARSAAGEILRPCDPVKPVKKATTRKRAPQPKKAAPVKKTTTPKRKPATRKAAPKPASKPESPSADQVMLDTLKSIQEGIAAL